ncbi:hypothetical protein [Pseudobacter ginsenosidimutans]|jgi:hypothetical protein|uniref:Uncharacterized protein n=1 Tax=Pseudobacter ginsenosidimutans TaxID=661488 RepID=A0A4V2F1P1_9BACT|nr:hypothetical protein [Pseudobacter ginsenosidimutans]QEC43099.1 hypothetical protein FSB84_15885 [Pseudobacter ginsenosidimutans]RZS74456.1 hypothetical protein EV199_0304 [Pseudobacter ginsenosidimutans]
MEPIQQDKNGLIDEQMMSPSEMIEMFTEPVEEIIDEDEGVSMHIHGIEMDLPVQLMVAMDNDGTVQIGVTPPLYKIETSFTPVMHQLRFRFEKIE